MRLVKTVWSNSETMTLLREVKRLQLVLLVMVGCFYLGCVGPGAYGDRAMEVENYDLALQHYEKAIDRDSRDPDLYFNAAKAAQHLGKFAQAERYFSQSLRYGGGSHVARALAEFYIQTSNFAQAVRIYQYLLRTEEDVQPLYTNIGTALMYAGKYIDAESHLLLAQQMNPSDPVPYINLGVLYDRHMRNPPKSVRFYDCFTQMVEDSPDRRNVLRRLQEYENSGPVDASRVNLVCGEAYRASQGQHHDLRQVFSLYDTEALAEEEESSGPMVIERLERRNRNAQGEEGESQRGGGEPVEDEVNEQEDEGVDYEEVRERARSALGRGHFDRVITTLDEVPVEELVEEDRVLLGRAYYQTGRFPESAQQWEVLLEMEASPEVAGRLIDIYERMDAGAEKQRICERFSNWPDYVEALRQCEGE